MPRIMSPIQGQWLGRRPNVGLTPYAMVDSPYRATNAPAGILSLQGIHDLNDILPLQGIHDPNGILPLQGIHDPNGVE